MKILILVGKPGSGKSTYASKMTDYEVINQDTLGNRHKCLSAMARALELNKNVLIDRTNINKKQRSYFIDLAKKYNPVEINCVYISLDIEDCVKRIQARKNHPTIKEHTPIDKVREIVLKFDNDYEEPTLDEGFDNISYIGNILYSLSKDNKGSRD